MRRNDRDDDPFSDIFRELERMMEEMTGSNVDMQVGGDVGFGDDVHFSIYEEDASVRIVGDLPGVRKEDLQIKCDGQHVTVGTETSYREYEERITLPARVDEHSATATFNNGVLEMSFDRAGDSANIDVN